MKQHYERGATVSRDRDPWAWGGYVWFQPGQMTSLMSVVIQPEGCVHFAGEHTSLPKGWIERSGMISLRP